MWLKRRPQRAEQTLSRPLCSMKMASKRRPSAVPCHVLLALLPQCSLAWRLRAAKTLQRTQDKGACMTMRRSSPHMRLRRRAQVKRLRLAMRQERTIRLLTLYRLKHRLGILWQMTTTHLRVVHLPPAAQPSGSLPVWERPTTALEAAPQGTESVDTPPPPVSPGASATTPMPTNTPIWEAATTYLAVPPDAPPKPDAGAPAAQSNRAPIA